MSPFDGADRDEGSLSRRGFLGRSTLAAGVLGAASAPAGQPPGGRAGVGPTGAGPAPARPALGRGDRRGGPRRPRGRALGPSCRFVAIALAEPAKPVLDGFRPGDPFPQGGGRAGSRQRHRPGPSRRSSTSAPPSSGPTSPSPRGSSRRSCSTSSPSARRRSSGRPSSWPPSRSAASTDVGPGHGRRLVGRQLRRRAAPRTRAGGSSRALCFVRSEPSDNGYARPLDGVVAVRRPATRWRCADRGPRRRAAAARGRQLGRRRTSRGRGRTSSRWRSSSPRGRASPSTATRSAGRSGGSASASRPARGWCCTPSRYHDGGRERPILTAPRSARWSCPTATRPSSTTARTPSTSASTASARWPTRWRWAATASGTIRYFDAHLLDSRGKARHDQERGLPARGGRRHPLEAHRLADQPVGGPPLAAAVGLVHRHGRQLRLRLLLALLPGRLDPVRGEADRDHEHHGAGPGRDRRPTASRSRRG